MAMKPRDLAKMIDHTLLSATATVEDIRQLCQEAIKYKFAAVCVNPIFVPMAVKVLKGSSVKVATVVGFPLGADTTETKAYQTRQLVKEGAQEIDMVMNISAFKSKAYDLVKADIKAVTDAARISSLGAAALVKVIIETCYLTEEEIVKACQLSIEAGADFVKTSTGFGTAGAKPEHVSIMRKTVGREMGVKASGGVRSLEDAIEVVNAGANRIGTSSGVAIVSGNEDLSEGY